MQPIQHQEQSQSNMPAKAPKILDYLAWADFVVGIGLLITAVYILVLFVQGIRQPEEYSQWIVLFAPAFIGGIIVSTALGIYLTRTPHRLSNSSDTKHLRSYLRVLMGINLIILAENTFSLKLKLYLVLISIAMIGVCTLNILCLSWVKSLLSENGADKTTDTTPQAYTTSTSVEQSATANSNYVNEANVAEKHSNLLTVLFVLIGLNLLTILATILLNHWLQSQPNQGSSSISGSLVDVLVVNFGSLLVLINIVFAIFFVVKRKRYLQSILMCLPLLIAVGWFYVYGPWGTKAYNSFQQTVQQGQQEAKQQAAQDKQNLQNADKNIPLNQATALLQQCQIYQYHIGGFPGLEDPSTSPTGIILVYSYGTTTPWRLDVTPQIDQQLDATFVNAQKTCPNLKPY